MEVNAETMAASLIIKLSEIGFSMWNLLAQMAASFVVSADNNSAELFELERKTSEEVLNLLMDPSQIWEGLLPGSVGPGHEWPEWEMIDQDKKDRLERAYNTILTLQDDWGTRGWEDAELIDVTRKKLIDYGWIDHIEPVNQKGDQFAYVVTIIVNPEIRHDEPHDILHDAVTLHAESPLSLAQSISDQMERIDKIGKWPAEEQAAWISRPMGEDWQHWLMTWDHAQSILAIDQLERHRHMPDDMAQAIQDEMSVAGALYASSKG